MKSKIYAFTIVEIIVSITILSVLATLAFLSLTGYTRDSRNAARIHDINLIERTLYMNFESSRVYPFPDNAVPVYFS